MEIIVNPRQRYFSDFKSSIHTLIGKTIEKKRPLDIDAIYEHIMKPEVLNDGKNLIETIIALYDLYLFNDLYSK